jgi:hypothetical protein
MPGIPEVQEDEIQIRLGVRDAKRLLRARRVEQLVGSSSSRSTRRRPARNSAWSSQIRIFIRFPDDGARSLSLE